MKRLLIKYSSEITLKGLNRRIFEDTLIRNIRNIIGSEYKIQKQSGRIFIDTDSKELAQKLTKIFGVIAVAEADLTDKRVDAIAKTAIEQLESLSDIKTFKIESRRADKSFPLQSMELSKVIGSEILKAIPEIKVDVHNPDIVINIEVRDNVYVYGKEYRGVGGLPYKTSGKGMLLLSGGIDSPVAGYMLARRGLELSAVYYHSHPYTSEKAKEKVIDLAKKLTEYTGAMRLHIVPFTKIQMDIIEKCKENELTIIMRRFMMQIAERLAQKEGAAALITGESLGQVASQTLESMYVTNSDINMPVFRPLVGMDKVDIMNTARQIGSYDISILPYEDCCTIFVPKHPKTKPKLEEIKSEESKLNFEELIKDAIENTELIVL